MPLPVWVVDVAMGREDLTGETELPLLLLLPLPTESSPADTDEIAGTRFRASPAPQAPRETR
ncbi:hypothetical protein GCM10009647_024480 [Streptomyces sanglieri]